MATRWARVPVPLTPEAHQRVRALAEEAEPGRAGGMGRWVAALVYRELGLDAPAEDPHQVRGARHRFESGAPGSQT